MVPPWPTLRAVALGLRRRATGLLRGVLERAIVLDGPFYLDDPVGWQTDARGVHAIQFVHGRASPQEDGRIRGQKAEDAKERGIGCGQGEIPYTSCIGSKEYPPLFEFDVVRDVRFRLAVEVESNTEVVPERVQSPKRYQQNDPGKRAKIMTDLLDCERASATYARPVFFREMGDRTSAS